MTQTPDFFPEIEGTLDESSPSELIAVLDEKRVTGVLEAHDGPRRWELTLRGGNVVGGETTLEGEDPIESFLELSEGKYRFRQQVALPGDTVSERPIVSGSFEQYKPTELLRCCEEGGLTGTLRVLSDGKLAEALFDTGLLTTVTLDGHQDVDVHEIWRWTEGEFAILAVPAFDPPPNPVDSGLSFLKEFEIAAVEFLDSGNEPTEAAIKVKAEDRTVKVVYLDTADPYDDTVPVKSRYAKTDVTAVVVYAGAKRRKGKSIKIPTVGDPVRMALAPAKKVERKREAREASPAPEESRQSSDIPWPLILTTALLLALITVILYFTTLSAGQ